MDDERLRTRIRQRLVLAMPRAEDAPTVLDSSRSAPNAPTRIAAVGPRCGHRRECQGIRSGGSSACRHPAQVIRRRLAVRAEKRLQHQRTWTSANPKPAPFHLRPRFSFGEGVSGSRFAAGGVQIQIRPAPARAASATSFFMTPALAGRSFTDRARANPKHLTDIIARAFRKNPDRASSLEAAF